MSTDGNSIPDIDDLFTKIPHSIASKWLNKIPLDKEEICLLEKYSCAAANAAVPVTLGIEAIGNMLAHVDPREVGEDAIRNMGWLIAHLGRQASLLFDLEAAAMEYMHPRKS